MKTEIGKNIKELRNKLSLTQSELAEPEMTKGMLSHIENGHANPSIKNLEYLAKKLGKPISYFLQEDAHDEVCYHELNDIPENKILEELKNIDNYIHDKKYVEAVESTQVLLNSFSYNKKSKLYADIIYRLGVCNIKLKNYNIGEKLINECCSVYVDNKLYIDGARACMKLLEKPLLSYNYNKCPDILDKAYELYHKSSSRDIFLEIEMLVTQPAVYSALGDLDKTMSISRKAINLSKENHIYYHIDDSYRFMATVYLIREDYDNFIKAAEESRKYAEFTNNKFNLVRIYHNFAKYENKMNNPVKALEYLELLYENSQVKSFYYYIEHGKAKYLLKAYDEALEDFSKINFKEKPLYIGDCIYLLTGKIYKGITYAKLNDLEKAREYLTYSIEKMEQYLEVEYLGICQQAYSELTFAYESLSEISSQAGDFQEAYSLLKKSNDYKTLLKR